MDGFCLRNLTTCSCVSTQHQRRARGQMEIDWQYWIIIPLSTVNSQSRPSRASATKDNIKDKRRDDLSGKWTLCLKWAWNWNIILWWSLVWSTSLSQSVPLSLSPNPWSWLWTMDPWNIVQTQPDEACSPSQIWNLWKLSLVKLFARFINKSYRFLDGLCCVNLCNYRVRVNEIAPKYTLLNESRLYPGVMCVLTYNYKMLNSL